ncbi:hypothetical protein CCR94_21520 [Rhodoblastus sphagnicola]|uniref:Major tropism determinant N-terminal domain-containing protein n=1 Tax=Rhodoblastus sphagnicola TaxID=333368 RepID=A0A2S6MWV3_9HYPH|nr:hypothetical protein [Rhodoblastus sphagnicola]MBB4200682.1 hypothetical protein [Rhodoblastus sphagnicola]PPQ26845.1 hypothetical protein CCR94_21520 [Rhodoblastus sphagnicola]
MSVQLKRRRDTAANVAAYTGAQGELIVDLTNNRLTVHDGVTPGGWAAAKLSEVAATTRTSVSDLNYTALITDRTIAYTAITAARTVTLPAVSAFPTGVSLRILDESGAASASKTITLSPNGSDVINGAASAAISSPYGYIVLQGNGAASPGKWTIADQAASNLANVGVGVAADPNNVLSAYGSSALFNGLSFNLVVNKSAAANTASILFQDGFSGRAQVGLAGDDNLHFKVSSNGSSWTDALVINATTGQANFPQGIASGDAAGFRNRLRNASFAINQRNVSGTVTLAAGAYGHDGVRAGASGATYTFAASGIDTTITVTAGSLILPIESNLIEGGAYMLSHAGAAQARVWQGTGYSGSGSYASAPFTATALSAATQTNVEFSTGTILRPQFEPGAVATAFERRPPSLELAICQYYFRLLTWTGVALSYNAASSAAYVQVFQNFSQMRSAPTSTGSVTFSSSYNISDAPSIGVCNNGIAYVGNHTINSGNTYGFYSGSQNLSAEI